jgi:hypothetical protein
MCAVCISTTVAVVAISRWKRIKAFAFERPGMFMILTGLVGGLVLLAIGFL